MRGNQKIRIAALALAAAAALPRLASAEEKSRPWEEARIEQLIEQAIRGDAAGPAAQPYQAAQPAQISQASPVPLVRSGIPGR